MSEKRVLLDTAAFLDAPEAFSITAAPTAAIRTIVQRFLSSCYEDAGKAPRLLDGDELAEILLAHLPSRFGAGDELGPMAEEVLATYLKFLQEHEIVTHAYEQRRAFEEHIDQFATAVADGRAHSAGTRLTRPGKTVVHRAEKVGRNDPCPCGSGAKFKKCCMKLGGA